MPPSGTPPMTSARFRRALAIGALTLSGLTAAPLAWAAPPNAASPVPDPGKATANADDASAIAVNPANLAFLAGPEFRWNLVWTGSESPLPNRGTSFAGAVPIGPFATGLRLDLLMPPDAAPAPYDRNYHWIRWALALGTEELSLGTTFGWGISRAAALDGYFSLT